MYPRDYFDTYWRTELRNEVFVAMPFHDEFLPVWEEAIRIGVEKDCPYNLTAKRVDVTTISGSIITDIMDGIAHAKVVLADISVCETGAWQGQRNGNVMYEVGLAHALRQNTEVILVRSDDKLINFDLAGITVHHYPRHSMSEAKNLFAVLVSESIKQTDQTMSLKVQRAIDAMDADCLQYLKEYSSTDAFVGPRPTTMGEELFAISRRLALSRLQNIGIVRCLPNVPQHGTAFTWTEFGRAVLKKLGLR